MLSLLGVVMGVASLFGWTRGVEPLLWVVFFVFYAWCIAQRATKYFFLHGFFVSVINGIWISIIHAAFYSLYTKNNPEVLQQVSQLPPNLNPRLLMLVMGPLIGAFFGIFAGLFAWIAAKFLRRREASA